MYTKETICKEIQELAEGPITMGRTEALAQLLYIKERCHEFFVEEEPEQSKMCAWVKHMQNADGTVGAHWPWHEAEAIRAKYGISCGDLEFYVALNMMYSDYCVAIGQAGASTVELYARMAVAFLNDKDAQPGKLERYYRYIAAHE